MKNLLYLCGLFLVLLVSVPLSFGQDLKDPKGILNSLGWIVLDLDGPGVGSLKDLQAISVLVEGLPSVGTGLTEQQIKTDVELQLRKAGIRVGDSLPESLYVSVNIMDLHDIEGFVFNVRLEVKQRVTLLRGPPDYNFPAITWISQLLLGVTPKGGARGEARSNIRGVIHDVVDEFLNDYLTANPITR